MGFCLELFSGPICNRVITSQNALITALEIQLAIYKNTGVNYTKIPTQLTIRRNPEDGEVGYVDALLT